MSLKHKVRVRLGTPYKYTYETENGPGGRVYGSHPVFKIGKPPGVSKDKFYPEGFTVERIIVPDHE